MQYLSRRSLLIGATTLPLLPAGAHAQAVLVEKLMQPGALPDMPLGSPNAPVTVIEYASLTCHHCYNFHKNTWPAFKAKYVDTGKVRFILREFPLDPLATAGFMLARCAGDAKWYPMIDALFQTQEGWAHADKPLDALAQTVRQTGMSREQLDACLRDEKVYRGVTEVSKRGSEFGVNSTPTFFINGQREIGALTLEQFDTVIEPLLVGKAQ